MGIIRDIVKQRGDQLIQLTLVTVFVHLLMKVSSSFKLERDPFGHYQKDPSEEDYNLIIINVNY